MGSARRQIIRILCIVRSHEGKTKSIFYPLLKNDKLFSVCTHAAFTGQNDTSTGPLSANRMNLLHSQKYDWWPGDIAYNEISLVSVFFFCFICFFLSSIFSSHILYPKLHMNPVTQQSKESSSASLCSVWRCRMIPAFLWFVGSNIFSVTQTFINHGLGLLVMD